MLDSYSNNIYADNLKPERDRYHTLLHAMSSWGLLPLRGKKNV